MKICPSASERQEFKDALDGMSKFQTIAEGLIKYEKLPADALTIDSYILNRRARIRSSFHEIKDIQVCMYLLSNHGSTMEPRSH